MHMLYIYIYRVRVTWDMLPEWIFHPESSGDGPVAPRARQRVQNGRQSQKKGPVRTLAHFNLFLSKQDTTLFVFPRRIQRRWSRVSTTSGSGRKSSSKVKNANFGPRGAKKGLYTFFFKSLPTLLPCSR